MYELKTCREFLYNVGALSCAVVFNSDIGHIIIPPSISIGILQMDLRDPEEGPINICYFGIGKTGLKIGHKLSEHVGRDMQAIEICRNGGGLFSCPGNARSPVMERPLEKQDIVVLVDNINKSPFFDLRKYLIARATCIWTIGMVPDTAEKVICDLHYVSNEILRIVRGLSFPYQDSENFIQTMLAIYMVQCGQRHDAHFDKICMEAMDDLGL